jgi:cbb3-type cytochrome oxidase maturation protein
MDFLYLVPIALALGVVGLAAFMWSLRNGQYDDLDGAAERILFEDDDNPCGPLGENTRKSGRIGSRGRVQIERTS